MNVDKLKVDLLAKGWNVSEVEQASQILEAAEGDSQGNAKFVDGLRIVVLGSLMIANGFICSKLLVPFMFAIPSNFILIIAAIVGFIFSMLFTLVIYDFERIHHAHETNLFVAFIVSGAVNFYLILEFTAQFGIQTKLPLTHNIYLVAGTYFVAFLIPQLVYQMQKRNQTKYGNI
jgi:hypothetical protein